MRFRHIFLAYYLKLQQVEAKIAENISFTKQIKRAKKNQQQHCLFINFFIFIAVFKILLTTAINFQVFIQNKYYKINNNLNTDDGKMNILDLH